LEINYLNASKSDQLQKNLVPRIFKEVTSELDINYRHQENVFNDFQYEVLLPHIYSRNGPDLAINDVNNDGLDDFYVGGASGSLGELFLQQPNKSFQKNNGDNPWYLDSLNEDINTLLFDTNQNKDLDLYVINNNNKKLTKSPKLQDRLYLNQDDKNFNKSNNTLPKIYSNKSQIKATNYDKNNNIDLFVKKKLVPRSYPKPAKSYILRNDNVINSIPKFINVTEEIAPDLLQTNIMTDGVWTNFNQNKQQDLVIVKEWIPLTFLKNHHKTFENKTQKYGLSKTTGWWYSILAKDFDDDRDIDFVTSNLGLNYKYQTTIEESFDVFAYDYDKNGNINIVLSYYNADTQYPLRGKQCSSQQIPAISIKFEDYNSFTETTLEEVYSEEDLNASLHYQVHTFANNYIENHKNENFSVQKLPNKVQLSSINGIVSSDFNNDQHLNIVITGNLYNAEVETTRNDAGYGYLLYGDGQGNFTPVPYAESGIYIPFDTKDLKQLKGKNRTLIIAANNSNTLTIFQLKPQSLSNILNLN